MAKIWMRLGKQPSRRDLAFVGSDISYKAYERRFGRWSTALKSFVEDFNAKQGDSPNAIVDFDQKAYKRRPSSRDINLRLRFLVMSRDNFKCCICGASPAKDPSVVLHVDHIKPWAKGGETEIINLQTLCSRCNQGKSDLEIT
jgi:predicted restriction endonuclease